MKTNKNIKVFIVDDDKVYSTLIRHRVLSMLICDVTIYEDGSSCINNLHQKPDIIFLDFSLGDKFAPEIMAEIKVYCPKAKVIIISGQTKTQNLTECFRLGAYDYIEKNVHTMGKVELIFDELISTIKPEQKNKNLMEVLYSWLF